MAIQTTTPTTVPPDVGSTISKGSRLTSVERAQLGVKIRRMYEDDRTSIEKIAKLTGRSYNATRRHLLALGVRMRPVGRMEWIAPERSPS